MLSVTSTLLEAAASGSATPYVRLEVSDRDAGAARLRFARWYEGVEAAGPAGAAMPADGSLVRARVEPGSGALFVQRVETPSESSTYDSWTALGTVAASAGVGLHAAGTRVLLAYSDGSAIRVRESTDSGATFGAASTVASVSGATAAGCAVRPDGSALAVWAVGGVVTSASRSTGGAWGAPAAWPYSLASVNALAVSDEIEWAILVSGVDDDGFAGAWATRLGSGIGGPPGHWLPPAPVILAAPGTGVTYRATGLATAGVPRLFLVESYAGGAGGGAFDQALMASAHGTATFLDSSWRDPAPLAVDAPYGVAASASAGTAFLASPAGVWRASTASTPVAVGARLLDARYEARSGVERLRFRLADVEGQDAAADALAGLTVGGEIAFSPGYVTDAGQQAAVGRRCWVTSVARSRGVTEVEASGAFGLLDRWRASRQITWDAGTRTVAGIASDLGRFAGVTVAAANASAAALTLQPGFTIRAGESGGTAMRRLLAKTADLAIGRGAELGLFEADPDAAPVATYGGDGLPIRAAGLVTSGGAPGWARAFGDGVVAQATDVAATEQGGGVAVAIDQGLDAAAEVADRAAAVLRRVSLSLERAWIEVTPHPGQEPGDLIEVTCAGLETGDAPARWRVVSVRLDFARRPRGRYVMRLGLGAP